MSVLQAIILGLIQGLTEFLPVSSSGHLVLAQQLMHINGEVIAFDVLLHLASLTAVIICLRKDLFTLIKKPFQPLTFNLIVSTFPAVIVAILLKDWIESTFSGQYLAIGFLVTALLLTVSDICTRTKPKHLPQLNSAPSQPEQKRASKLNPSQPTEMQIDASTPTQSISTACALVMGLAQSVAMLPGISRSGATIASGTIFGASRETATRYSFLMSVPIILASAVYKLPSLHFTSNPLPLILGALAAFASSMASIKLMLALIKNKRYWGFAIYLVALSAFTFALQYFVSL